MSGISRVYTSLLYCLSIGWGSAFAVKSISVGYFVMTTQIAGGDRVNAFPNTSLFYSLYNTQPLSLKPISAHINLDFCLSLKRSGKAWYVIYFLKRAFSNV